MMSENCRILSNDGIISYIIVLASNFQIMHINVQMVVDFVKLFKYYPICPSYVLGLVCTSISVRRLTVKMLIF